MEGGGRLTNESDVIEVRTIQLTFDDPCGCDNRFRREIVRVSPTGAESVIAFIEERCNGIDQDKIFVGHVGFDPIEGRLAINTEMVGREGTCTGVPLYNGFERSHINGFTTLFDVLQTFTPTEDAIGFRVPYMPEGNQLADFFDTYTGDLATVGDWSQLQPLACGYPATAPNVGDYLAVADTLADPAPGTGRYYLTVANFMGQRRFGRKNANGTLSGRDPTDLPACD